MAINPEEFWDDNYYGHPPLTDNMIVQAEWMLGVALPEEFIKLLRVQNGGYTKGFAYPMGQRTTWAADHVPLDELFGIVDPAMGSPQNILDSITATQECGLPERQVILTGDGHWWITLDYRNGPPPCVSWIDVECKEEAPIAPSFGRFLEGLVPSSDFE